LSEIRALTAEAIGTFGLVFAGPGAIMIDAQTGQLGHVGVAITFGLIIMVMIAATGHISGAHFNPAVTLAFAAARHFPWHRVPRYWGRNLAAQFSPASSCARCSETPPGWARRCRPGAMGNRSVSKPS